jgi:hypothetical protein
MFRLAVIEEVSMHSFYAAYQAFERRAMRGEFHASADSGRTSPWQPLAFRLGDFLIQAGLRLKRLHAAPAPLSRSSS